jgi:hypothetical protein
MCCCHAVTNTKKSHPLNNFWSWWYLLFILTFIISISFIIKAVLQAAQEDPKRIKAHCTFSTHPPIGLFLGFLLVRTTDRFRRGTDNHFWTGGSKNSVTSYTHNSLHFTEEQAATAFLLHSIRSGG